MIVDNQDSLVFQVHPPYLAPSGAQLARSEYRTPEILSQKQA